MALRLRRGTDTERQLITPVQGELIYTTDTEQLYVGDGTTAGGVPVDKEILLNTTDLLDVDEAQAADRDVLIWNDTTRLWEPKPLDLLFELTSIDGLSDVDTTTTALSDNDLLRWDSTASLWSPIELDLLLTNTSIDSFADVDITTTLPEQGDLLSWDSTIASWTVIAVSESLASTSIGDHYDVDVTTAIEDDVLTWDSVASTWIPKPGITEGGNYKINVVGSDSTVIVNSDTNEHFGFFDGQFYGDLKGDVFAGDSSLMVDSTTGTLLGELKTGLVTAEQNYIEIGPDENVITNDSVELRLVSIDFPSTLRLANRTDDPSIFEDGSVSFSRINPVDGTVATSTNIVSTPGELIIAKADPTGVFTASNNITFTETGSLVIGGTTGTAKLNVEGDAYVNGNAEVEGNIVSRGYIQFGSFTTTERDALTPFNGMVLYNTTANRFQGHQNNVWINLDDGTAA